MKKLTERQNKLYGHLLEGGAVVYLGVKDEITSNRKLYEIIDDDGNEIRYSWPEVEKVTKYYGQLRTSFDPEWYEIAHFVEAIGNVFYVLREQYLTMAAY